MGQRLTGMSGNQAIACRSPGSIFKFSQHGQCGAWVSELLPHTAKIVDELCFVKSMHTEAINHDPAITFFQTGSQLAGRPSMGAWLSYGLGSENENLPAFVVLITQGTVDQPLYARLWGSGFLPARAPGRAVPQRQGSGALPGEPRRRRRAPSRRAMLDRLRELQHTPRQCTETRRREIDARIAQYEMAYRMQTSVPGGDGRLERAGRDVRRSTARDARTPGTFAANCLLARRLAERDVRFIQLYHQGWDQHGNLPARHPRQCRETRPGARPP